MIVRSHAQAVVEGGVGLIGRWVGTAVPSILPVVLSSSQVEPVIIGSRASRAHLAIGQFALGARKLQEEC